MVATADWSASFAELTARLSAASVRHRREAYRAVDWDDATNALDAEDPRWELPAWDPLGASAWYRAQPAGSRRRVGLQRAALLFKVGIEFEAILGQGLLRFAATLPNGSPAFRYAYHEAAEELQHSMMFQEFINRSGVDAPGSPERVLGRYDEIAGLSTELPAMFFLAALTGEEIFDHLQRRMLAERSVHPLFRAITRIHIAEEARHLSFARAYLDDAVPRLGPQDLRSIRYRLPFLVDSMYTQVFGPEPLLRALTETGGLPSTAVQEIARSDEAERLRVAAVSKVVRLCGALGLVDRRLAAKWSDLGFDRAQA